MINIMVHKVGIILLFLSIMVDALEKGENIFDNEERYLIKKQAISKRHVINRLDLQRINPFFDDFKFNYDCRIYSGNYRRGRLCQEFCDQCQNGICIGGSYCLCNGGWEGRFCTQACINGRYGVGCKYRCTCQNGVGCDKRTGKCYCKDGWVGNNCSKPCTEGYFGYNCKQSCQCKNSASCDHITGRCSCAPGYQGPLCEEKCPVGSHGYQCTDECKCQNDAICHHVDGSCDCPAGWTGPVCAERCPEGLFGMNCSEECNCYNNATCNFITGECTCTTGYYGENCEIHCLSEGWEMDRSQGCRCEDVECSHFVGNCTCFPQFNGSNYQVRGCPVDRWGYKCLNKCTCSNGDSTGACCLQVSPTGKVDFLKQSTEKEGIHSAVTIPAICAAGIILLLVIAGVFYYTSRRTGVSQHNRSSNLFRFRSLKNETEERTNGNADRNGTC